VSNFGSRAARACRGCVAFVPCRYVRAEPPRRALWTQLPLLALMVICTFTGLLVLGQAIAQK
jgi:hypothetical protein